MARLVDYFVGFNINSITEMLEDPPSQIHSQQNQSFRLDFPGTILSLVGCCLKKSTCVNMHQVDIVSFIHHSASTSFDSKAAYVLTTLIK
jgi:hypothetical protein